MNKYSTICAKISEKEREELNRFVLNPTEIIRKAVREEIRKATEKILIEKMKKVNHIMSKFDMDEIVSDIREDMER